MSDDTSQESSGHPQDAPAGTTSADEKQAQLAAAGATAADAESESDDAMATDG